MAGSSQQAMADFKDATRRGSARWQFATYPEGKEDFPVNGVCWYYEVATWI